MAGLGVSLMPKIGIKRELTGLIHVIDHPALPMTTQWNLVWRKNKKLSPVAAGYPEFLKANFLFYFKVQSLNLQSMKRLFALASLVSFCSIAPLMKSA